MRTIYTVLFTSIIALSCNTGKTETNREIVFFMQSDDIEIISDFEYVVGHLTALYADKNIPVSVIESRNYTNGKLNITIDENES